MFQLLKFELYKIYKQKSIYILFILLIAIVSSGGFVDRQNERAIYQDYQKFEGKITKEKMAELEIVRDEVNEKFDNGEEVTSEEHTLYGISELFSFRIARMQEREDEIAGLASEINNATSSYKMKKTALKKDMLASIDSSQLYYQKGPAIMIDMIYTFGFVITAFMTIIGIGPIFSKEYSSGMDQFLLSSKFGRSKLVTAKILASLLFILSIVSAWSLYSFAKAYYLFGMHGWKSSLQSLYEFIESPYSYNLMKTFFAMMTIHIIAALAFGLITVFTSSLSKKVMVSILASGMIFGIPLVFDTLLDYGGTTKILVEQILNLSIYRFMKVKELFSGFYTYNIFGTPILHPIVAVVVSVGLGGLAWYMTKWVMKRDRKSVV